MYGFSIASCTVDFNIVSFICIAFLIFIGIHLKHFQFPVNKDMRFFYIHTTFILAHFQAQLPLVTA